MRNFIALAFAATAAFATVAQAAPLSPVTQTDNSSVHITGTPSGRYQVYQTEFDNNYAGSYVLSNGKRLSVTSNNSRFFAQVDKGREFEIIPTGYKTFASKRADVQLKFDEYSANRTNDVVMVAPPF
jgi:hypothetical protein